MLLIVGLGNPGKKYEQTRHNAGFMLIDHIASSFGISLEGYGRGVIGTGVISGHEVALLKPQTYMNLSGEAVVEFASTRPVETGSMIVAYDDCDLPPGKLRLRKGGGSGGHRGVESIIGLLGSRDFRRVRLGVGRPLQGDIVDYVLSPFSPEERPGVEEMLGRGKDAVEEIIKSGIEQAMNRFNC